MKVEIYTTEGCEYSEYSMDWFMLNSIEFKEIKIRYSEKKRIEIALTERTKQRITTFPQIFINGMHIGGHFELMKKRKNILELKEKELNGDKNILKNGLYLLSKS